MRTLIAALALTVVVPATQGFAQVNSNAQRGGFQNDQNRENFNDQNRGGFDNQDNQGRDDFNRGGFNNGDNLGWDRNDGRDNGGGWDHRRGRDDRGRDDNNDRNNGFNLNVYRFFNGQDHFLTLNQREGINARYRYEGVAFQTYRNAARDRVALYRCSIPGAGHFASLRPDCEGQNQEGTLGYLARRGNQEATQAVYRCNNGRDHLITVNRSECLNNNYRIESVLGYVQ